MDVAIAVVGGYCGCLGIVAASAVNTKTVGCMYLLCNFSWSYCSLVALLAGLACWLVSFVATPGTRPAARLVLPRRPGITCT